ncbi:YheV family putative zinc ribbon protein [Microbulbifer sp. 2205BS26-8]|uniref:YheV family putative zinc ribbon protein n=1 Tax=Microbulbifer sp. 2205BS26-8 TaxID=3064386 RepID=UPI00273D101F|nr:YheV family putative zinc ribbon protein [Microbulbifer sp. 2205BS26-8]MDP5209890.1 YheV family putative zinc ribbon protein [Microbulbifer sp. 2205BS26-8]
MPNSDSPETDKQTLKKRFIAAAVCPRCSVMDKVVNYRWNGKNYRECIACGFVDEIRLQSAAAELQTRVNQTGTKEIREETVKFIFPGKENKK